MSVLFNSPFTAQNPDSQETSTLKRALLFSLALHGAIFLALIIKSAILPSTPHVYVPSMRVDLVALPGHKITETPVLTPPAPAQPEEAAKPKSKALETKQPDADVTLSSKKPKKNQDRLKNALAKIKALAKISSSDKAAEPIKGNRVSKGSSVTGEAKNALETSYYDVVLEKVRTNWELPKWLQEKPFSAQVVLVIDRSGNVTSLRFLKSSGNNQFDQEVRRAIQVSAPFSPPPTAILPEVAGEGITLGFPI